MSREVFVPLVRRATLSALVLIAAAVGTFELTNVVDPPHDAPALEPGAPGISGATTHALSPTAPVSTARTLDPSTYL